MRRVIGIKYYILPNTYCTYERGYNNVAVYMSCKCDVRGQLGLVNPLITVGAREMRRNGLPVFDGRPNA